MARNFTVGRDASAVLIGPNGARFDFSNLTDFDHKAKHNTATSKGLHGPESERYLPLGHDLTFSWDRTNNVNEGIAANIEAQWWAVGSADPGTSEEGAAYIYITEFSGAVTTHQFRGVSVKFEGLGNFKSESAVAQKITAHAQKWDMV
jgi:hypothetical protein